MAIFEAQSKEELEAIVKSDPAVKAGAYTVSVRTWRAVLNRGRKDQQRPAI